MRRWWSIRTEGTVSWITSWRRACQPWISHLWIVLWVRKKLTYLRHYIFGFLCYSSLAGNKLICISINFKFISFIRWECIYCAYSFFSLSIFPVFSSVCSVLSIYSVFISSIKYFGIQFISLCLQPLFLISFCYFIITWLSSSFIYVPINCAIMWRNWVKIPPHKIPWVMLFLD